MTPNNSRGHLYTAGQHRAIRVSLVVGLFALAYLVLTLAVGTIPMNLFLRKTFGTAVMPRIWQTSLLQVLERTVIATAACWITMAVTGRARGRLTGSGMLALGSIMSGALAGAIDVGVHKHWVSYLTSAARRAPWQGHLLSDAMTVIVAVVITLLFIVRSMRVTTTAD
jgi:hypothetical protein